MSSGSFNSAPVFLLKLFFSSILGAASVAHAADVFKGRDYYANYCEVCHSVDGRGKVPGVPNFARGEGLMYSDLNLLGVVQQGKGAMPAYRGLLSERQILDVIAYLRTLRR